TTTPSKTVTTHDRAPDRVSARSHVSAPAPAPASFAFPSRLHFALPGSAADVVFGLWLIAALVILGRLAFSLVKLELLKRDALPLSVGYRENMVRWASAAKGSREVRLCVSDRVQVPVAVGLFDSMILIPSHLLETLSQGEVDQITLHELAHLRRADDWTNGVQRIVQALFFFNPAVLWIAQQLDLEREVACDDWVLSHTGDVRPYAFCLTKMAEVTAWPHRALAAPGVFVTRKSLSIRVERLLRAGRNIGPKISLGTTGVVLAALGVVFFALQSVAPSFAFVLPPDVAPVVAPSRLVEPALAPRPKLARLASPLPAPAVKSRDRRAHVQSVREQSIIEERIIMIPARHVHVRGQTIHVPPVNVDIPEQRIVIPRTPVVDPVPGQPFFDKRLFRYTFDQRFERKMQSMRKRLDEHFRSFRPVGLPAPAIDGRSCIGCDLQGVNWKGRKVAGGRYMGGDFKGAMLQNVDFSSGIFTGVDFQNADLRGADFRNTRLAGVDFRGAQMVGTLFEGARLTGIDLSGGGLAGVDDTQVRALLSSCTGCDLHGANLNGKDLHGISVIGSDFRESNVQNARLNGANLIGSDFSGANLRGADLSDAILCASQTRSRSAMTAGAFGGVSCVDLQGADLHGVNLRGAQVCGGQRESRSCRPVDAAMLRNLARANLDGASGI
ncbi:MAG: pentapeptide repeat-containing protein, partial [Candidatus Eremiobacteraeota bacterium]|nr:pentapeptide repeat-containing protein [Candidatus Eremiobacteraeota bacterium]